MDRINLQMSETPEIHIRRINGSLRIKGWDRNELRADSDESDTLEIKSTENTATVDCRSGCMIRVPIEGSIQIDQVDRELMLKSIECPITVGKVSGQIMAKSIGPLSIKNAYSNLIARNVEGTFDCDIIDGNANLQDIDGKININKIHGNLVIKGFTSGIHTETYGNTTLRIEPESGGEYYIKSKGNISCRLSPETSGKIKIQSGAKQIHINDSGSSETLKKGEHEFTVGEGESNIILIADGIVDLTIPLQDEVDWSYEFDLGEDVSSMADDISQIVSEQLESQLETLRDNLNNLTLNLSHLGPLNTEKNREKLEAKRIKLERKLARVERRATDKARLATRRAAAATRRFSKQKVSDPISDTERQKVLEMLQNKLISVQEAEVLLAALEGREPDFPAGETGQQNDLGSE